MPYVPVTREAHEGLTWKRATSYERARTDPFAPLVAAELGKAGAEMPLCFLQVGETFMLAGLLSPVPGRNLFVAPDGRWLGSYIPAWYRSYPFRLLRREGTAEQVLCVDDAYEGLGQGEETFFAEGGKPSKPVADILQFTTAVETNRTPTDLAVAALAEAGLIVPWAIDAALGGGAAPLTNIFRIDDKALAGLTDEAFLKLRKTNGLPIAYAQLFSASRLTVLAKLYELHAQADADQSQRASARNQPPAFFTNDDELLF